MSIGLLHISQKVATAIRPILIDTINDRCINHMPKAGIAGYYRKKSNRIIHTPDITEYDKLPGDQYQTVYVGYYDDKRHTDPRALDRFYRLNWGGWIRAKGGRSHYQWRKEGNVRFWDKQHLLCNERQTKMLEQMFEQKYRKKTFFVDDPYEIYEDRDLEFLPIGTRPHNYSYIKQKKRN